MPGETNHELGKDGVARAKLWLEKTGRAEVRFSRYEVNETPYLSFTKPDGAPFSFDMGGVLHLETGNVQFLAEVKNVTSEAGQGNQYRDYLGKCYRASAASGMPYHFMWVTWHPFNVTTWTTLCESASIKEVVQDRKNEFCGDGDINEGLCDELADRLWLIVLSKRQESLSMSDAMLGELRKAMVQGVMP